MQGFKSAHRDGGGFVKGHVGRFDGYRPRHLLRMIGQADVLGIGAKSKTGGRKNRIAYAQSGDILADCLDFSG
jgi:hypothetical protein